jgi:hypothetical protein
MAGIIETAFNTGQTLYAHVRSRSGQVWNGAAFEAYNSANWSTYDIALTEDSSSGYYKATFPAAISASKYTVLIYLQAGGSPTLGDPLVGSGSIVWDGTAEEIGVIQSLIDVNLNRLIAVTAASTPATVGSYIDLIMNKNGSQTFDPTTDSLEALRDSGSGPTAAQIADAVWDENLSASEHATANSTGERLRAIDEKLPTGTISDFDETANSVNLNPSQTSVTIGTVNALGTQAKADVNAEVVDVFRTDTLSELASGAPTATPTLATAVTLLYMALRNKATESASEFKIYNNSGTAICKATVSDSGVEFTREQLGAP